MSKISDLKKDPKNNINVAEIFQGLFPDLKTKYIELLLKLSRKKITESNFYKEFTSEQMIASSGINYAEYEPYEALFLVYFSSEFLRKETIETFLKFCEYNEKGQIENNDVTAIEDMEFIDNEVSKVDIRNVSKEMKNQIVKLHEDDTWLVIKPLTVEASRKYGSNTKWCTTAKPEYHYFHDYASNGILIYTINKRTGYKVALYKALTKRNNELSFWDQKDVRIDSMETDLPMDIYMVLASDIKTCKVSNRQLLSEEERIKEEKMYPRHEEKTSGLLAEAPIGRNPIRVRDAEEDMEVEEPNEVRPEIAEYDRDNGRVIDDREVANEYVNQVVMATKTAYYDEGPQDPSMDMEAPQRG